MMRIGTKTEGPVKCQLAWGSDMPVGAHVFKSGVRFDPGFGPDGSEGYPMGSARTDGALDAACHRAWFAERACVRHMIRPSQMDAQSVVKRAFRHGYGVGRRRQREAGAPGMLASLFKAMKGVCAARLRRALAPFADPLRQDFEEARALGLARGCLYPVRRARAVTQFREGSCERRAAVRTPAKD
jgi:hypothetical protein